MRSKAFGILHLLVLVIFEPCLRLRALTLTDSTACCNAAFASLFEQHTNPIFPRNEIKRAKGGKINSQLSRNKVDGCTMYENLGTVKKYSTAPLSSQAK